MKLERPFKKEPDFEHLRKTLMREITTGPVPIIEVAIDPEIMSIATGGEFPADRFKELVESMANISPEILELGIKYMDFSLAFYKDIGYDYVSAMTIVPFPRPGAHLKKGNPQQPGKVRAWREEHKSLITSRSEFEAFSWPTTGQISLFPIDYLAKKIPTDMKIMVFYSGIVEEIYKKYGDRIAILGGVDVDLLARGTTHQVRARTRQVLEACAPRGGFCIGSGNSVANFCKIENYYAMLDEARKWNEEH